MLPVQIDPRRPVTMEYVKREIAKVPQGVYVLVLNNFRDLEGQHKVSSAEVCNQCCSSSLSKVISQ